VLIVTTDVLPGYEIRAVLGGVMGIAARSRNPYQEGVKALSGPPNPDLGGTLARWRQEAIDRMTRDAVRRGANAIIGMRFDHREISSMWTEICAYGTAVVAAPVTVERAGG
jgi:uncharacterized protein YbjQ (UPF0145 family)